MELDEIIDDICVALTHEGDLAQDYAKANNNGLYLYHQGVCDGLCRALVYAKSRLATKKAAMPASTAADDPHEETNNDN